MAAFACIRDATMKSLNIGKTVFPSYYMLHKYRPILNEINYGRLLNSAITSTSSIIITATPFDTLISYMVLTAVVML